MEVVGSVDPSEIPHGMVHAAQGVWTRLADQVMEAHQQGKVLVIKASNQQEFKRMRNGMAERLRKAGYSRSFTAVDEPDGSIKIYCQLVDIRSQGVSVVKGPVGRPRRRASA